MSRYLAALMIFGFIAGCKDSATKDASDTASTDGETAGLTFWPPTAGQGTTFDARISASSSVFGYTGANLDLGAGVTVNSLTVLDGWTATANITVAGDAPLGERDATVVTGDRGTLHITSALDVVADSFTIDPPRARIGESVQVEFLGNNTHWEAGNTWAYFGDDIDVTSVQILSETYATANVTVGTDAVPGLYDVAMEVGPQVTTLYSGFQVDRVSLSAQFDPTEATQGQTVDFTIDGLGTHFEQDHTDLEFWKDGDQKGDILVDWINVVDAEHLYGQMTLSNAAEIGWRDVLVNTRSEGVFIGDAFEVKDAAADLTNVGISLTFHVARGIDNATGAINEQVTGQAIFYIPLDPPCGAGSSGSGPQPYDANGVFPDPPPVDQPDCPNPETVGAGEHVWFESPCNVVQLDRYVDGATGLIYYTAPLTLDDYCFDQAYDLHTEGEEGGIGEYILPGVQPTVPADYQILSPDLWGDYTQNRAEDFHYTWTPAMTYPDAIFATGISGTLVSTGEGGFAGSIPWDDGDHTYTPAELEQLEAGNVSFYAYSYIQGPYFGFPFSTIQTNQSSSYLYTQASMVLE